MRYGRSSRGASRGSNRRGRIGTRPPSLDSELFVPADSITEPYRTIALFGGHEGVGKSTLLLQFPRPMYYINIDRGLEGVLTPQLKQGLEICTVAFDKHEKDEEEWTKQWLRAKRAITYGIKDAQARTIAIDSEDLLWDLCQLGRFGRREVMPFEFKVINREYESLLGAALDTDKFLVMSNRVKKKYFQKKGKSGKDTAQWDGKSFERKGYGYIHYVVQTMAEIVVDATRTRFLDFSKCRQQDRLCTLEDPEVEAEFVPLMMALFPDTEPDMWLEMVEEILP